MHFHKSKYKSKRSKKIIHAASFSALQSATLIKRCLFFECNSDDHVKYGTIARKKRTDAQHGLTQNGTKIE